MRAFVLLALALLVVPGSANAQIGQTGVLTGTVTDPSGAVLPGVTVSVTSPSLIGGARTAVTDENGTYRFPALPPGTYAMNVELQGFKALTRDTVRLELGQTVTVDARLEVGAMQESVTVTGESPVVDVKSSSSQKNLSTDMLENLPFGSRFGPTAMIMAPGVHPTNLSSYGSGGSSSNSYMIDGVDVSDPEGGTIWVFANYNWIQEVQVIGLGADAEFGGFTGVASNSLFRSGSNRFSGLLETLFENDALTGDNASDEIVAANPDLDSAKTFYVTDTTAQIGGPIKKDKAWFFASGQYFRPKTAAAGFPKPFPQSYQNAGRTAETGPTARLESSPRFLFKPTVQLTQSDKITGFFELDSYTVDGRGGIGTASPGATVHQDSPEVSWNGNYTKVLSSSTVFDTKYSGFWGYYYLSPYNGDDRPGWYDVSEDFYSQNSYYFYNADRTRHQANATLTHYASGFGDHNLKFGAEFERSSVKSELGYPGGMYVSAYSYDPDGIENNGDEIATPYYGIIWDGYLKDNVNKRFSGFAQDSWSVNRKLTINGGLRFDKHSGFNKHLDETVFKTFSLSPRIGFALDVQGNGKTVLRGHYGVYFDGAKSSYYDLLDPQRAPIYGAYLNPDLTLASDTYVLNPGAGHHTMDSDIRHPQMRQAIIGFEREIVPGFSLGVTGIYRRNKDFIEDVLQGDPNELFVTRQVPDRGPDGLAGTGDETSAVLTTYRPATDRFNFQYLITNPEGAFRRYRGLELIANKRLANRWMMQSSWVISSTDGNYNNTSSFGNGTDFDDPNFDPRFQPFRTGKLTNDITHLAKVGGLYQGPWGVNMSGLFYYTSGQRFNRTQRESLGQGLRRDLFIEPRGSQRYDNRPSLDVKFEKQFQVGAGRRLGLTLEGFNVMNDDAITLRTVRSGSTYFTPTGLVQSRRFRIGAVLRF